MNWSKRSRITSKRIRLRTSIPGSLFSAMNCRRRSAGRSRGIFCKSKIAFQIYSAYKFWAEPRNSITISIKTICVIGFLLKKDLNGAATERIKKITSTLNCLQRLRINIPRCNLRCLDTILAGRYSIIK